MAISIESMFAALGKTITLLDHGKFKRDKDSPMYNY